jgi:hypothetical protein
MADPGITVAPAAVKMLVPTGLVDAWAWRGSSSSKVATPVESLGSGPDGDGVVLSAD